MLMLLPVVRFGHSANVFAPGLRQSDCCVSWGDIRLLCFLDYTITGSYSLPRYQSLAREGKRSERRLAELDYSVSAALQALEEAQSWDDVHRATVHLQEAVLRSRSGAGFQIGTHIKDRERSISPQKGLVSNGVL